MKKHAMRGIMRFVTGTPWAITPEKLDEIMGFLNQRSEGVELSIEEIRERIGLVAMSPGGERSGDRPYEVTAAGVAVIPLQGVLAPRMNLLMEISGGTSTEQFTHAVDAAAADRDVRAIVIDADTPGGSVSGTEEATIAVRNARDVKPVIVVARNQLCSAGYSIASGADEIVVSPSTLVGSLGVFTAHTDRSKAAEMRGETNTVVSAGRHKTDGNDYEPLSDQGKATMQERVDDYYAMLIASVAVGRRVSEATVEANFGQGKAWIASKAIAAGMADRIGTLDEVLADLGRRVTVSARPASFQEHDSMNKQIFAALVARGLIGKDASDAEAMAALHVFYAATGRAQPGDDQAAQVLTDLAAQVTPPDPPPVPPVAPPVVPSVNGHTTGITAPPVAGQPQGQTGDGESDATALQRRAAQQAVTEERNRISEIQSRGELLQIDAATVQAAVDGGTSLSAFLEQATRRNAESRQPVAPIRPGEAERDKFHEAAVSAMLFNGGVTADEPTGLAASLTHRSAVYLAEESLRRCGVRATMGDPELIIRAALGDAEAFHLLGADVPVHGPGSFPNVLSAAANKSLEAAPEYEDTTFQHWANRKPSVPDFKPSTLIRIGEFGEFPQHVDGDDFEQSTMAEDYSWISVDSYGDEVGLTPVMMVNDDLGAFFDSLSDKRNAHDLTLNRLCVDLLTGNVTMVDGYSLFDDTNHGNDIASGGVPGETQFSAMRLRLRRQQGVSAKRKLRQTLSVILIPEDLETTTEKELANLQVIPADSTDAQVFRGRIKWYVEPQLADSSTVQWYGFANPARARSIVYCFQRGYEKMKRRDYYNPKNNCRIFQFEGRFAAGVNNYRGVVRNAGA